MPQARVAVHTSTLMCPSENILSTRFLSCRNIPAWWMLNPSAKRSRSCLLFERATCKESNWAQLVLKCVGRTGENASLASQLSRALASARGRNGAGFPWTLRDPSARLPCAPWRYGREQTPLPECAQSNVHVYSNVLQGICPMAIFCSKRRTL